MYVGIARDSMESRLEILGHVAMIVLFSDRRHLPYSNANFSNFSSNCTLDCPSHTSGISSLSTSSGLDMR